MALEKRSTKSALDAVNLLKNARNAQKKLKNLYSQQIDYIVEKMSNTAYSEAFRLADLAVLETWAGNIHDKAEKTSLFAKLLSIL